MDNHISDPSKLNSLSVDYENLSDAEIDVLADGISFPGLEEERNEFLAGLSEKQTNYLLENIYPGRTGVEDFYLRGQRMMKPYYDIPKQVARSPQELAVYKEYKKLGGNEERAFAIDNPSVFRMEAIVSSKRKILRIKNSKIDEFMVIFNDSGAMNPNILRETRGGLNISATRNRVLSGVDARLDESLRLSRTEQK